MLLPQKPPLARGREEVADALGQGRHRGDVETLDLRAVPVGVTEVVLHVDDDKGGSGRIDPLREGAFRRLQRDSHRNRSG